MHSEHEAHKRLTAFGTQLKEVHYWLRNQLEDLRDGVDDYYQGQGKPATDLRAHCLAFCSALTRHHTGEDKGAFPALAEQHPELIKVIADLRTDHNQIEWLLGNLRNLLEGLPPVPDPATASSVKAELEALSAVMQTHFIYEEKKLVTALNELERPDWRTEPPAFLHQDDD